MTKSQIAYQEKIFHTQYFKYVQSNFSYMHPVLADSEVPPDAVIQDARYCKNIFMGAGSRYGFTNNSLPPKQEIRTGKRCRVILSAVSADESTIAVGDGSYLVMDKGAYSLTAFDLKTGPLSYINMGPCSLWYIFSSGKVQIKGGTCGICLSRYSPCSIFAVSGDVTITLDSGSITVPEGVCITWRSRSKFTQEEVDRTVKRVERLP